MNIVFEKNHQRAFGTFPLKGEVLRAAIEAAIAAGYRAFDTAQMYQNEADTGAALAGCGILRDQLFIITMRRPPRSTPVPFTPPF